MSDERIISYEGNEPYIFISYSHLDSERVMPILRHIQKDGYRIWYDDGTESGIEWAEAIEQHLVNASCMIAFLTENYLKSDNCLDEIEHAKNKRIKILMIYLEDIKITGWLEMRHNRTQAVLKNHYDSEESFYNLVYSARMLDICKNKISAKSIDNQININFLTDVDGLYDVYDICDNITVSAKNGNNNSQLKLGKIYYLFSILEDTDKYNKKYIELFTESSINGNAEAQYWLGQCYHNGDGIEKDYKEAIKWYIMSANNEYNKAQHILGMMYYFGEGVNENNEESIKWFIKSAENGNTYSQQWLSDCYYYSKGIKKDYKEALKWYKTLLQQKNLMPIQMLKMFKE